MTAQSGVSQKWGSPSASLRMVLLHLCRAHPLHGWDKWLVYPSPHLKRTRQRPSVPSSHVPCVYLPPWLSLKFSLWLFTQFRQNSRDILPRVQFSKFIYYLGGKNRPWGICPFPSLFLIPFFLPPTFLFCLKSVYLVPLSVRQLPGHEDE